MSLNVLGDTPLTIGSQVKLLWPDDDQTRRAQADFTCGHLSSHRPRQSPLLFVGQQTLVILAGSGYTIVFQPASQLQHRPQPGIVPLQPRAETTQIGPDGVAERTQQTLYD